MRGLAILVATAVGAPAAADAPDGIRARTTDHARERGATAGLDPWSAPSVLQLFGRPSLDEGLKLSLEASEKDTVLGVAVSPDILAFTDSLFLRGLQLTGAYGVTSTTASFGLKWSISWRDTQLFDDEDMATVFAAGEAEYEVCVAPAATATSAAAVTAIIIGCEDAKAKAEDAVIEDLRHGRWAFAIGASATHDFAREEWSKIVVGLSGDVPLAGLVEIVVNLGLESVVAPAGRRWSMGGGGALSVPITAWDEHPIDIAAAVSVLACAGGCDDPAATIRFGPRVSVALTDDAVLAAAVSWDGTGDDLGKAFASLALSHSFGLEPGK